MESIAKRRTTSHGNGGKQARPVVSTIVVKQPGLQSRNGHASPIEFDAGEFLAGAKLSRVVVKSFKEKIFSQGDAADAVFYIQKGKVKIAVSAGGKEGIVAVLSVGEFVGEDCIATIRSLRMHTATALNECVLLKIGKADMFRVLDEEPRFSDVFLSFLLTRTAAASAARATRRY